MQRRELAGELVRLQTSGAKGLFQVTHKEFPDRVGDILLA
jgi:hypothetical protein